MKGPMNSRFMVPLVTTEPDARAVEATCDSCGRRGTVARVRRTDIDDAERRYCAACWPERRAEEVLLSVESGARFSHLYRDPTVTWDQLIAIATAVERVAPSAPHLWRQSPWRGPLTAVASYLDLVGRLLPEPVPATIKSFIERTDRGRLTIS